MYGRKALLKYLNQQLIMIMSEQKMIPDELNLDAPWRISEHNFRYILDMLTQNRANRIYEFGSGASSIRLSMALPESNITSIEHDFAFYKESKALKKKYRESIGSLNIEYRPLKWQFFKGAPFLTYSQIKPFTTCDVVIIDGPPYWTRRGREACLYHVFPVLKKEGLIILDDIKREQEQKILKNWLKVYPGAIEIFDGDKEIGTLVMKKIKDVEPQISLKYWSDKYEQYMRYLATKFLKRDPNV